MRGRGKALLGAAAVVAALFAVPAVASADDRFAEPGGNGAEPCLEADPCSIETAINDAPSGSGVLLAGGTYTTSTELIVAGDTSVSGDPDDPAVIDSSAPIAFHVAFSSMGSIVKDFAIDHDPVGGTIQIGLQIENGITDRVVVESTGNYACFVQGLLYDSFCHMEGDGQAAGLFSPGTASGTMTNVTAIGDGSLSRGLVVASTSPSGDVDLTGYSVIAQGGAADVSGFGGTGEAHMELSNSAFTTLDFSGTATGTLPTVNGNIDDEPALAADSLHQMPASPTIDAGSNPLTQPLDIDGDSREQGNAVDIGADEADGVGPQTKITKKPPRKTKSKTAKFAFSSTEPGSSFACKLDRKPYASCGSAKKYKRLKPGKHKLQVKATDEFGNEDPSAASYSWKIKKPKKKHHR